MKYFLLLFIFTSSSVFAQKVKIESEKRISEIKVPRPSLLWIKETFPKIKKIKWFEEVTSGNKSYEAKFQLNRKRYSVEFGEAGNIEDVEITIKMESIDDITKIRLLSAFKQIEKFKLSKIQQQWSSNSSEALSQAVLSDQPNSVTIKYEVEFTAVIDGTYSLWEGLFDENGILLSKKIIKLRATDNLDY
jgi:hypothetical protein